MFSTEIESPEYQLLETCRELGVAVVAYSPLSRGLLTGTLQGPDDFEEGDVRRFYPRFSAENFPKNKELVDAVKEVAANKRVTAGQTALAWLLSQGDDIFPIPGFVQTLSFRDEVNLTWKQKQYNYSQVHQGELRCSPCATDAGGSQAHPPAGGQGICVRGAIPGWACTRLVCRYAASRRMDQGKE